MTVSKTKNLFNKHSEKSNSLISLCLALTNEKDIIKLLDMIVHKSMGLTSAEAGSLYMVREGHLDFEILQNVPLELFFRRGDADEPPLMTVPLYKDGKPNHSNVCTYTALTGKTINIEDVYNSSSFDFSGTRAYDTSSGFRSKSMLTIPLKDHEDETVAVLQLINKKEEETDRIIPFAESDREIIEAIASQTAIAIVRTKLIQDLRDLLDSFVKAIAWAVDAKSHYTGEHIKRVVKLTMEMANIINNDNQAFFKDFKFSEEQLEELRYSAWMHDIGKIATPQHIIDKKTKLQHVVDGIQIIENRFDLIRQIKENLFLKNGALPQDRQILDRELDEINEDFAFLFLCNKSGVFMDDEKISRLKRIQMKEYSFNGKQLPYITEQEYEYLSIKKGTLTDKERKIIENHAVMTGKILHHLPFPKSLSQVPLLASSHHEKPNGSGYPRHLKDDNISLQAKIMAIADIFEALTAEDRPYKDPMTPEQAVQVLMKMEKANEIDSKVFAICRAAGFFNKRP